MKHFFPSNIMLIPFVVKHYDDEEEEISEKDLDERLENEQETRA